MKAYRAAQLAGAAYPGKGFPSFEAQGFAEVAFFDKEGTQVYILESGVYNVVVFRGSDEKSDWWKNLTVSKVRSPYGRVHKGFTIAINNVWSDIVTTLNNLPVKPIVVIGHSKGAAEATLATERLNQFSSLGVTETHLFGSPRVGDAEFARNYDLLTEGRTTRYVNNNDIVCRVPSVLRFRHVRSRAYFNKSGDVVGKIGSFKITVDRLFGRFTSGRVLDGTEDHDMWEYSKVLSK